MSVAEGGGRPVLRFRRAQVPPTVWSPLDAFFYNLMSTNVAVFFGVWYVAGATFYYPLTSLTAAIVITGSFCLLEALVYAWLVSSMPRNGGDYTFQSRLLPRPLGAVFALAGIVVGGALWMVIAGWVASRVVVGPFAILLGQALRAEPLVDIGKWVMSTAGLVAMGLLAIGWSALLTSWSMRVFARVQRVLVIAGLAAGVIPIAYFVLTRLSLNVSTYRSIIYRAVEVGFSRQGHSIGWEATRALLPLVAFGLIYPGWVAFQSAEVRRAGELRVQLTTIVGAKTVAILLALVVLPLPIHHAGEQLFGASVYLALNDPDSFWQLMPRLFGLPGAPWLSVVVLGSLAIAINAWFWAWVPNHTLAASRVMLSMSWDHLLPRWMSVLHPRNGTPVRAILAFSAVSAAAVLLYMGVSVWQLAVQATLVNLITFAVTCLAAVLFPFLHREQYRESTAAPFELLRVPVISLAGLLFVCFAGYLGWLYLTTGGPSRGLRLADTLVFIAAVYGAAAALYVVLRRYRHRHEGGDAEIYYREAEPDG